MAEEQPQQQQPPPLVPPPPPPGPALSYYAPGAPAAGVRPPGNGLSPAEARKARSLVSASAWLGWGGLLVLFGLPCGLGALRGPMELIVAAVVLGLVMTVVGAVLGQIGRAMQGRVI